MLSPGVFWFLGIACCTRIWNQSLWRGRDITELTVAEIIPRLLPGMNPLVGIREGAAKSSFATEEPSVD